jgi:hypothetical protein
MPQKIKVARRVNTRQGLVVKGLWRLNGAELAPLQFMQDVVNPCRHFKTRHQRTAKHFKLALVQGMTIVVKRFHWRSTLVYGTSKSKENTHRVHPHVTSSLAKLGIKLNTNFLQ